MWGFGLRSFRKHGPPDRYRRSNFQTFNHETGVMYLFVSACLCPMVCLFVCLPVYLSVCLSRSLSLSPFPSPPPPPSPPRLLQAMLCWVTIDQGISLPTFIVLLLSSQELSDTNVYEPEIRALLGIAFHFCEMFVLKLCCVTTDQGISTWLLRS